MAEEEEEITKINTRWEEGGDLFFSFFFFLRHWRFDWSILDDIFFIKRDGMCLSLVRLFLLPIEQQGCGSLPMKANRELTSNPRAFNQRDQHTMAIQAVASVAAQGNQRRQSHRVVTLPFPSLVKSLQCNTIQYNTCPLIRSNSIKFKSICWRFYYY